MLVSEMFAWYCSSFSSNVILNIFNLKYCREFMISDAISMFMLTFNACQQVVKICFVHKLVQLLKVKYVFSILGKF